MKYALVIFETDASRAQIQADRDLYRKAYETWIGETAAAGKLVGGDALDTGRRGATTVRKAENGVATVGEGPVHGGEETLGGWFVLEVTDHAEAVELACSFPTSEALELRPLLESA
ncbi:YciI family protein [Streptomyces sp. NBC_01257]|uniref:YciI family protein n=1 Tax=Streptomyces sp. NBC_01257 TaxID=2903799 RepID=UPI002DDBA01F|nr:YciI family protein [Streptomyces sp. NBC_01257]WRZ69055.1 YciI family protein [Streptomyces sp. NBC_01257]